MSDIRTYREKRTSAAEQYRSECNPGMEMKNSADSDYKARYSEVERQIESIKRNLKDHSRSQAEDPLNYGFVGDLGQALSDLKNVHAIG